MFLVRSTKLIHVYVHGIQFMAFQGDLLELLGRLRAGVNRKILCATPNLFMFTYLEFIFFAFQGHLLELLECLGAGVNRKYLVRSTKFVHVYLLGIYSFGISRSPP